MEVFYGWKLINGGWGWEFSIQWFMGYIREDVWHLINKYWKELDIEKGVKYLN